MNVLFVSLTRFGDLLQTQASINDVALAGHSVGIVCLQNFLPTVHLMRGIAHVFPFIQGSLLANMASKVKTEDDFTFDDNSEGWLRATKELKEWREMVWREFAPDVVVNLSPAMTSRLLASYLGSGDNIGGFSLENQASYHNSSLWASVMQGAKGQRGIIPYNLVDIFRGITADALALVTSTRTGAKHAVPRFDGTIGQSGLLPPSEAILASVKDSLLKEILALGFSDGRAALEGDLPKRGKQLALAKKTQSGRITSKATFANENSGETNTERNSLDQTNENGNKVSGAKFSGGQGSRDKISEGKPSGFFAIQLGASAIERQWPVASFAKVGDFLWENYGLVPVLLGTKSEQPLANEYEKLALSPHISMVGKTGLVDLSANLLHCLFLLTNDTGTMHLAAGLGVPSFAIFLATAQPFDTGPYLQGCYCFEPDLPCHPCNFDQRCPHEYICRYAITPETVVACMEHFFLTVSAEENGSTESCDDKDVVTEKKSAKNNNEVVGNKISGQGARVWFTALNDSGALSLQSLAPLEEGNLSHVYARSRDPLVKLQRAVLWAFLASYQNLLESGEAHEAVGSPSLAVSSSWFTKEAQEAVGQDAERLLSLIDILERQGSVLLLRPVELMRQRFLESWEAVYRELSESLWFCFLASLWLDRTNVSDMDFKELMGVVRIVKRLFEDLTRLFPQSS